MPSVMEAVSSDCAYQWVKVTVLVVQLLGGRACEEDKVCSEFLKTLDLLLQS